MPVILVKRNEDRNYDRLFRTIEQATMFGRAGSVAERQTPRGYEVTVKYLDDAVATFIEQNPDDFELLS